MSKPVDKCREEYGPLLSKTLKQALCHCISTQFPRIGGPRIQGLCADMILEVLVQHLRPLKHVRHGQALWMGIDVDNPPTRRQRITDAHLVPVLLDLSTAEDVEARIARIPAGERLLAKAKRLCRQAMDQGALLSNADLAELLCCSDSHVAGVLAAHERKTQQLIPRRATLHDMGSGLTHKRIICWKRYAEGKSSDQVARETYHSLEAVDRYLRQFDRVRHCRQQNLTPEQTAFTLNCSVRLVHEYLALDDELTVNKPNQPKGDSQ